MKCLLAINYFSRISESDTSGKAASATPCAAAIRVVARTTMVAENRIHRVTAIFSFPPFSCPLPRSHDVQALPERKGRA